MYEINYFDINSLKVDDIKNLIEFYTLVLNNNLKSENLDKSTKSVYSKSINSLKNYLNIKIDMAQQKNEPFDYTIIDKMIKFSKELGVPLNVYITGYSTFGSENSSVPMSFSQEALDNLVELNNYLVDKNENGLLFMENPSYPEYSWNFTEVISANDEIDEIVDYIKKHNFTAFETVAFIHQYIASQFEYKENSANPIVARSIIGVLNSDNIVCMGYAYLEKAIIDKLNIPGLECSTIISKFIPKQKQEIQDAQNLSNEKLLEQTVDNSVRFNDDDILHMQNTIKINDEKYNVKGTYIEDVCKDSKSKETKLLRGISCMMFPVEDLLHYRYFNFYQPNESLDELYKSVGLKRHYNPYDLPIIKDNIKDSTPIPMSAFKNCLFNMFKKMNPKESKQKIEEKVQSLILLSESSALATFNQNSKSEFTQEAYRKAQEKIENSKGE